MKRSNLFLMELVLDLFLFALCAAVCVGLILHAKSMSLESEQLTQAVYIAQDAAERYRVGLPVYEVYFADGQPDTSALPLELRSSVGDYFIRLSEQDTGADIAVFSDPARDAEPIYTLHVGKGVGEP